MFFELLNAFDVELSKLNNLYKAFPITSTEKTRNHSKINHDPQKKHTHHDNLISILQKSPSNNIIIYNSRIQFP
jgi:hypothetical protein